MDKLENQGSLFSAVAKIIIEARQVAYRNSNAILLNMYWQIGQLIVEDEQGGKHKAEYGKAILKKSECAIDLRVW